MIVYREQRHSVMTRPLLHQIQQQLDSLRRLTHPSRDAIVCALIDAGEWASAVADACAPERDGVDPAAASCLSIVVNIASAADAAWTGTRSAIDAALERAAIAAEQCTALNLPPRVTRRVSEGFAYYALGPELYAEAARVWAARARPQLVWCVGLRTIGVTLAATVSAALQNDGIPTHAISLRPRGHPFDRQPAIDRDLARTLTSSLDAWWLVIDEGPGISGSSIAGTARALAACGVPSARIVLMPGHMPEVNRLAESARPEWERHAVHAADYDSTWLAAGRLAKAWGASELADIAGGAWRQVTQLRVQEPATHPHHERRKYVAYREGRTTLLKFAGYGRYGRHVTARATSAAEQGWSPAPVAARDGWIEYEWIEDAFGVQSPSSTELVAVAHYLGFLARTRTHTALGDHDALVHMAVTNTRVLCGADAAATVDALGRVEVVAPIYVDGRMRPHEWVRRNGVLLKTDGVEHGDDHFFPGPCDIAWDVAGAVEEWQLGRDAAAFLVDRYVNASNDRSLPMRLPFYRAAYLAFRGAYTVFCRDQLEGTPEALRFNIEHERYRRQLEAMLPCVC